jgi:hypothetical protein
MTIHPAAGARFSPQDETVSQQRAFKLANWRIPKKVK